MNKYKVIITETTEYAVDVLASSENDAKEKATVVYNDKAIHGTLHYLETDANREITYVHDVTNTDDPFNPEN